MQSTGDSGRWRQVASVLLAEAERLQDPRARAARLVEVGDLYKAQIGDAVSAARYYADAVRWHPEGGQGPLSKLAQLAREGGDVEVTAHLVTGLSAAGRWVDVVTVLVRQAEVATDGDERAGLFLEAARLTTEHLADPSLARDYLLAAAYEVVGVEVAAAVVDHLEPILRDHPADEEAATHLGRLETLRGRPDAAILALTTAAAHARDLQSKARMLLDAAAIAADHAGRPVDAAVHAYEALVLDPEVTEAAVGRLEAIHAHSAAEPGVSETLTQIWERLQRPDRVHDLLAIRLAAASGDDRAGALLGLAEHAEYTLLEPSRAFDLYRRGLEEGRGDLGAFAAGMRRVGAEGVAGAHRVMIELFGRRALWRALVHVLEDEAAVTIDDAARAELLYRAGEVLETHLEDYEKAMEHFLHAFKLCPRDARYVAAGERLYRRREDWSMVDRLLDLQVRIADEGAVRRRLLLEQGRLRHLNLGQPWAAYKTARAAALEGASEGATELLSELVGDPAAWGEIEAGLRREAETEGATEAARILGELATLEETLRGRPDDALRVLREAVELQPDDPTIFDRVTGLVEQNGSRSELAAWLASAAQRPLPTDVAIAALRRAAHLWGEVLGRATEAREAIRQAVARRPDDPTLVGELLTLARASGEPLPLAEVLARIAAGQLAPPAELDRDAALLELARLYEIQLDDLDSATDCHRTLLSDDPRAPVSLSWMRRRAEARGDWLAVTALWERALAADEAAGDTSGRVERLGALAELAERHLGDRARSAGYLRSLWDLTHDAGTRDRLHGLYVALGDRDGETRLLAAELERVPDDQARAIATRLAALAEGPPPAYDLQTRAWERLAALDPEDAEPLDALARIARATGDLPLLERRFAARAALADGAGADAAARERALLLTRELVQLDAAVEAWQRRLAQQPDDEEALRYLQGIHAARGEHEAEVEVLERRIGFATDDGVRVALLHEAAVQAELRLGAPDRAIHALERVAALRPDDPEVQDELLRLYENVERHDAFLALAERRLETLEDYERAELQRHIARLRTHLGQGPLARAAWDRVHEAVPGDVEALEALVELTHEVGDWAAEAQAADLLGRLTEELGARRRWWIREARSWERADRLAEAIDTWRRLNHAVSDDLEVLVELRRVASAHRDHWTVARALEAQISLVHGAHERLGLERMLARVLETGLSETANAVVVWESVLATVPDDEEALEALKGGYAELDRVGDLVRVLKHLYDLAADDEERVTRLVEAARYIETHKKDPAEAFECWRRAFKLSGDADAEMLREMGRLAEVANLWDRYLKVLEVARGRARSTEQQIEVLIQQARVAEERLRTPPKAFALLKQAFELDPREGRALDELARVGELAGEHDAVYDAYVRVLGGTLEREARAALLIRSAGLLERHLGEPGQAFEAYAQALRLGASDAAILPEVARLAEVASLWDDLVTLYRERWERQSQPKARVETILELARVLEARCPDWERAFEQYLLALQLDPEDEGAREAAWRLADAHDAWPIIVRVLDLKARDTEEVWLAIALLHDVSRIQERKLGQPEKAFETLRRAFALETWNETVLTSLRRLAESLGRWKELAAIFEEEAGWAEETHARLRLYREAATLHGEHEDSAGAARILRHVVELDPSDDLAATSLARLQRETADWVGLAAFLETRLHRGSDASRSATSLELAALLWRQLQQPRRAEQVLRGMLTQRPTDDAAHTLLVDLLTDREEWLPLSDVYEARARACDGDERVVALRERARVQETHLELPIEAFRTWARVAVETPEDPEPVLAMARLVDAANGHEELLAATERVLPHADPDRQPGLLMLAGRLARDRFDNKKQAYGLLFRAHQLDRNDRALAREVAELARAERKWAELVVLVERYGPPLVAESTDDDRAATVRWALEIADLRAEKLLENQPALDALDDALRAFPDERTLLRRALEIAERLGQPEALERTAVGLARALPPEEARVALTDVARVLERLGASEPALRLWQRVLRVAPSDEDATRAVRTHATRTRDWELLAAELRRRIDALDAGPARVPLLLELATLHRTQRDAPEAAELALREALHWAPDNRDILVPLVAQVLERGEPAEVEALAHQLLQRTAEQPESDRDPQVALLIADLQLERARNYASLGDEVGALACLRVARARAPGREDVALLLADALYVDGELAAAAEIWKRITTVVATPEGLDPSEHRGREAIKRGRAFRAVGDDDRAIQAFEIAAHEPKSRVDALESLANLQEKLGRWEAAVRLREKLAATVEDTVHRAAAFVAAGTILELKLGKPARALAAYDKALEHGLGERSLLQRLLPLYRDQGRMDTALEVARRLLYDERDDNLRAELHCVEGELLTRAERVDEARQAYQRALLHSPLLLPAARGLIGLLDDATPETVSSTLRTVWQATSDVRHGDKRPVLELLGATLVARGDEPGAIEVYEELHQLDPAHMGAQDALAALYARLAQRGAAAPEQTDHFERAIRHRLAHVRAVPGEPHSLRELVALYRAAGHPHWAVTPLRLLNLLKQSTREESELARALSGPLDDSVALRFDAATRQDLVYELSLMRSPTHHLMEALYEALRGPLDAELSACRVEDTEPAEFVIPSAVELVERMAHAIDVPSPRIWLRAADGHQVLVEGIAAGGEWVVDRGLFQGTPQRDLRFFIGRALELGRGASALLAALGERETAALFVAAMAIGLGEAGGDYAVESGVDPEDIGRRADFLVETLDEEQLAALTRFALPVRSLGSEAFARWATGARCRANRMGFLLCGDLARALACAQQLEPEVSSLRVSGPESFRGLLAGSSVVTDLFSYAFGPAFHALLRTLPTDDHADVTDPP